MVLADVVRDLEVGPRQTRALRTLLTQGPYRIPAELMKELDEGAFRPIAIEFTCAELAAFLSAVVSRSPLGFFGMTTHLTFDVQTTADGDAVLIGVSSNVPDRRHDLRDLAFMQLQALMQLAGVRRLRVCSAPILRRSITGERDFLPCGRLFVKTGKQKYCGRGCQKRVAMQRKRQRERDADERRQQRRQREGA